MKWVFGADTTPFRKGLDDMRTQTKAFSGSVSKMFAGAFSLGLVVQGFKSLVTELVRVKDLAERFGETTDSIQRIGYAAEQSGTDIENVARAMRAVTKNSYAAATGNKAMAESFAAFGIDAAAFVNLPMEQKLVLLAKAMESSKGDGEKLALVMNILSKGGAEMIPLLAGGSDALLKMMGDAKLASYSSIVAAAKLDDGLMALKNTAIARGADVIDFFQIVGASLEWVLNLMNSKKLADAQFNKRMDAIAAGPELDTSKSDAEKLRADAEDLKIEEEKNQLVKEIAKLEEEAKMRSLSLAEQIYELEKKRLALEEGSLTQDENGMLKSYKEALEIEKEIASLKKKQKEDAEKSAKEISDATAERSKEISDATAERSKRIAEAATREEEAQRNRAFNAADPEGKIKILKDEQKELMRQSEEARKVGDYEKQIDNRAAAAAKGDDIAQIINELKPIQNAPTIATSSLASIGAGGSANLLTSDTTEQRKISLLQLIAENTGKSETGETKIPEPI